MNQLRIPWDLFIRFFATTRNRILGDSDGGGQLPGGVDVWGWRRRLPYHDRVSMPRHYSQPHRAPGTMTSMMWPPSLHSPSILHPNIQFRSGTFSHHLTRTLPIVTPAQQPNQTAKIFSLSLGRKSWCRELMETFFSSLLHPSYWLHQAVGRMAGPILSRRSRQ